MPFFTALLCSESRPTSGAAATEPEDTERVPVRIGTLHTVSLKRKVLPFQLFSEISGGVTGASLSFAPFYVYALNGMRM
mgnify:CR=1 FL=1